MDNGLIIGKHYEDCVIQKTLIFQNIQNWCVSHLNICQVRVMNRKSVFEMS